MGGPLGAVGAGISAAQLAITRTMVNKEFDLRNADQIEKLWEPIGDQGKNSFGQEAKKSAGSGGGGG